MRVYDIVDRPSLTRWTINAGSGADYFVKLVEIGAGLPKVAYFVHQATPKDDHQSEMGSAKPTVRKIDHYRNAKMLRQALLITTVLLTYVGSYANAQKAADRITCAGVLIDVWLTPKGSWPLAVIYDADGKSTCSISREGAGHDPLKPCSVGERCKVTGTYRRFGYEGSVTYSIQKIDSVGRLND
jgi:hypothetical protein